MAKKTRNSPRKRAKKGRKKQEVFLGDRTLGVSAASIRRLVERAKDIEHIALIRFEDGGCVSYISTVDPLSILRRRAIRRYEVGIFRPDSDTEIETFSTQEEGQEFYDRAVRIEQERITATAAITRKAVEIAMRQKKIRDRAAKLVFTKRIIRVRRDKSS